MDSFSSGDIMITFVRDTWKHLFNEACEPYNRELKIHWCPKSSYISTGVSSLQVKNRI